MKQSLFTSIGFSSLFSQKTVEKSKILSKLQVFYLSANNKIVILLLLLWGIVEISICAIVLSTHSRNVPSNFLNGLCEESECDSFIKSALWFRIFAAILLLIGNIPGLSLLMVPWFLNIALGIFPLLPIIVSSYMDYKGAARYYRECTSIYDILSKIMEVIQSMFVPVQ